MYADDASSGVHGSSYVHLQTINKTMNTNTLQQQITTS